MSLQTINEFHERALKIAYDDDKSIFEQLLVNLVVNVNLKKLLFL